MSRSTAQCVGRSQCSSITGDEQPLWIAMPGIKVLSLYSILARA